MYVKDDSFYLIGVASYGVMCGELGSLPGVYMKVSFYMDWINGNLN